AGVQNADDYQRKYDACKTEACRQQVKKDYIEATEQASKIILDLYRNGQLSTEESMILLTSYASKMMQGAGESQDGLSTPIFNMDAQRWTPSGVIVNPDFQQITLSNLVQKMKQSGASEQQIAMRVLQYQIAGQAIGSYSMVEQVDALYHSGVSLNTVINAIALKRGKALSINEIKAITSRYNNNAGSLVTANGQVIKNNGHQSTASESRGAQQSGGKGKVDGAHKTEQGAGKGTNISTQTDAKKYFGQQRQYWTKDPIEFNGNKVYQRNDLFDPKYVDPKSGKTNLQLMEKGRAPIGHDGKPVNLHHMTQRHNSPIAEVTQSFHTDNRKSIHINDNSVPSGINRSQFDKWRSSYWKNRANDFK
ncbi:HNH/ENDO VII family nuclease, partial [Snodgrassella communis]